LTGGFRASARAGRLRKLPSRNYSEMTLTKKQIYKPEKIPAEWLTIIRCVPNYDPCRDAGDCTFDATNAKVAIDWIENHFHHVSGKLGEQPYILGDHEKGLVANLFGWKRPDGTKRYRNILYFIGKGNSKTTLAAAIALLLLTKDPGKGKQIFCASSDSESADILFQVSKEQMNHDEWLNEVCEPYMRSIKLRDKPDFFKILSSKAETKHGKIPSAVILDELHVMDRELVDTLVAGQMKSPQCLIMYLTTSDYDQDSICNDIQTYAEKVISGEIDDPYFLPIVYKVDAEDVKYLRGLKSGEGDREKLLSIFRKANPGLGTTILEENMMAAWKKAQDMPSYLNTFLRLNCNFKTENETMWLDMSKWDMCGPGPGEPTDPEDWREFMEKRLKGQACYAGLDLASTSDFTALALLFDDHGRTVILPYLWVPEHGSWRNNTIYRERYAEWIGRGFITATPGEMIDDDFILRDIKKICVPFGVRQIAADSTFQGQSLCNRLVKDENFEVLSIRQNYEAMTGPCIEIEKRIAEKKINHGNNPVLRWMAGNTVLQQDASGKQCRPIRSKKRELKIDGMVAAIMALARLVTASLKKKGFKTPPPAPGAAPVPAAPSEKAWESPFKKPPPKLS